MADIKLSHKILIVIALLLGLSKLSNIKLSRKKTFKTVNRCINHQPERKHIPAPPIRRCEPAPTVRTTEVRPYAPRTSRTERIVLPSAPITVSDAYVDPIVEENTIHIDDATFNRFYR